jgi:hypothetical protein
MILYLMESQVTLRKTQMFMSYHQITRQNQYMIINKSLYDVANKNQCEQE